MRQAFNWRSLIVIFAGICLHLQFGVIFCWGNFSRYLISYMRIKGEVFLYI